MSATECTLKVGVIFMFLWLLMGLQRLFEDLVLGKYPNDALYAKIVFGVQDVIQIYPTILFIKWLKDPAENKNAVVRGFYWSYIYIIACFAVIAVAYVIGDKWTITLVSQQYAVLIIMAVIGSMCWGLWMLAKKYEKEGDPYATMAD